MLGSHVGVLRDPTGCPQPCLDGKTGTQEQLEIRSFLGSAALNHFLFTPG